MGRVKGLTKMTCDRCGKTEDINEETDSRRNQWHDIKRYTAIGGEPTSNLLCEDCNKQYRQLLARHDQEFNQFMTNAAGGEQ